MPAPLDLTFFEIELPVSVEQLWGALMTASPFMASFAQLRKYRDIQASHWRHKGALLVPSLHSSGGC